MISEKALLNRIKFNLSMLKDNFLRDRPDMNVYMVYHEIQIYDACINEYQFGYTELLTLIKEYGFDEIDFKIAKKDLGYR